MTRIIVAGASGLVGRQVVEQLARHDGVETHILLRIDSTSFAPNVIQHVGSGAQWPAMVAAIAPEIAISCLGTTMKVAGSREAFRAVDHDLLVSFAQAARKAGAQQMICVSSVGASTTASNFYLRTKGETEQALRKLDFERLDFIRPGLLTGGRRAETRTGESIGIMLAPLTDLLMLGPLAKYASTPSARVAQAIVRLALGGGNGTYIHENSEIGALAG